MKKSAIKAYSCQTKSRHLSPGMPLSEMQRLQREDADFISTQMFFLGELRQQKAKKRDCHETEDKLEKLSESYEFGNEVKDYLFNKQSLIKILFDAVKEIESHFDNPKFLRLEILKDGTSEKLFVLIHINIEPEDAVERLNSFDNNWWFKQAKDIRKHLEFSLEFE